MNKIIAKNDDLEVSVIEDGGVIKVYVNGREADNWRRLLDIMVDGLPPMGGTFYPEKGTMLAYYHALKNSHWVNSLEIEGDIGEMPCEDGVIY